MLLSRFLAVCFVLVPFVAQAGWTSSIFGYSSYEDCMKEKPGELMTRENNPLKYPQAKRAAQEFCRKYRVPKEYIVCDNGVKFEREYLKQFNKKKEESLFAPVYSFSSNQKIRSESVSMFGKDLTYNIGKVRYLLDEFKIKSFVNDRLKLSAMARFSLYGLGVVIEDENSDRHEEKTCIRDAVIDIKSGDFTCHPVAYTKVSVTLNLIKTSDLEGFLSKVTDSDCRYGN